LAGLNQNKGPTPMVDPLWWLNFGERAHVLTEIAGDTPVRGRVIRQGPAGQRVIRNALPGRDVTFVIGETGLGPTVDAGAHVIDRGPMPGGRVFTAFDTAAARK